MRLEETLCKRRLMGASMLGETKTSDLPAEWRDKLELLRVSFLQQDSFFLEKQRSEDRL